MDRRNKRNPSSREQRGSQHHDLASAAGMKCSPRLTVRYEPAEKTFSLRSRINSAHLVTPLIREPRELRSSHHDYYPTHPCKQGVDELQ